MIIIPIILLFRHQINQWFLYCSQGQVMREKGSSRSSVPRSCRPPCGHRSRHWTSRRSEHCRRGRAIRPPPPPPGHLAACISRVKIPRPTTAASAAAAAAAHDEDRVVPVPPEVGAAQGPGARVHGLAHRHRAAVHGGQAHHARV